MNTSLVSLENGLEDILLDLRSARSGGDLGRLALLAYCEVRRWAREADLQVLARHSSALVNNFPYASRDKFLAAMDELIVELEQVCSSFVSSRDANTLSDMQPATLLMRSRHCQSSCFRLSVDDCIDTGSAGTQQATSLFG